MRDNAIPQIKKSILIVGHNLSPIIIVIFASSLILVPFIFKLKNILFYLLSGGVMFIVYPSIYGRYTDILISGKAVPYSTVFKNHWANYLVINIFLAAPSAVIDMLRIFLDLELKYFFEIISIIVRVLSIYILPLVFINGKIWESIELGFKCSIGNIFFNLPIFLIVSVSSGIGVILKYSAISNVQFFYTYIYVSFFLLNVLIEFLVFISATTILKDKGIAEI